MKKLLLSLLCVFALAAATAHAETKTYQLCTDLTEILNPDNEFIILSDGAISNEIKAATNATNGSSVSVKTATSAPETIQLDTDNVNGQKLGRFSFKANGAYYAMYESTNDKYWGIKDNNTQVTSTTLTTANDYKLSVTLDGNNVKIVSQTINTRYFQFQTTYFRPYKGNSSYKMPLFYKEVATGPTKPAYGNFDEEYTIEIGESMSLPAITPAELSYTFTTDDTDVIELNTAAKTFKGLAEGVATVKFSTPAVDGKFEAGEGSFKVNVVGIKPTLKFRDQIVYGKVKVGVVWEPVTVLDPEDAELRGDITYSSSNPDVVSIDATTGQIKPEDVKAAGEAIITATMAAKGDYAEGTASYKIIVIDPSSTEPVSNISDFDFTTDGAYGMTAYTGTDSTMETTVNEITGPHDVVTITFNDAADNADNSKHRLWKASSGYELRVNNGGTFTVKVPNEYKISQIGFVSSSLTIAETTPENGAPNVIGGEWNADEIDESIKYDWIPKNDEVTDSVRFKTTGSTAKISKIYVLYESAHSNLKSANLSFTKVINNLYENEPAVLNAVNNPTGREISYSIENLDESEYTITPTADGKIEVMVKKPGYYSLQATSPADDTYRSGFAIMRVNVYHHLDMTVEGDEHLYATPIYTNTDKEELEVLINVPELTTLYYQFRDQNGNAIATMADTADEDCEAGFTAYEDGIYIPAGTRGTLVFYIAAYGYKSPKRYVPLSATSVEGFEHMLHAYGNSARMYYTIYINGHDDNQEYTVTLKIDDKEFTATDHEVSVVEAPQGAMMRVSPAADATVSHKATGYMDATGINDTNEEKTHSYEISVAHNGTTLDEHTYTGEFKTDGTTGIEDVTVEGAEGAVEYFNLQGVRVAQPQAGNIYLVRRAGKVTKELIK